MECTTCDGPHPQCPHDGTRSFNVHLVRCGAEEGDAWAALFLSRLAKGHVFDERTQLHERREMEGLDKGAVGPRREGLGPLPGISGAGGDHDTDVCSLGDSLDIA
jgi:hypothetical protein